MKSYKVTLWGQTEDLVLYKSSYADNGRLAIVAETIDGEPYAILSVNLPFMLVPDGCCYLDTNNCPWVEHFISSNHIGTDTLSYASSGWCTYPLYKIDLSKLEERKYRK